MRRIIIIGTAMAVLSGGAVAFAAGSFNNYTASETFTPSAAGSASHPSPFAISESWKASGANGHQTAPLTQIVAKNYGMVTDAKDFKVCTAATINNAGKSAAHNWNKACPGGETGPALIGQGPVTSEFTTPAGAPVAGCNPYLYIYNGGIQKAGKYAGDQVQVFFFVDDNFSPNATKYNCLHSSVHTGAAPAYNGYAVQPSSDNGNMWTLTIPLPTTVSTNAGGSGLYASLETLNVKYAKKTITKNGKVLATAASVACKNGKRPYSFAFTAQNFKGQSPPSGTTTVSHSATCS